MSSILRRALPTALAGAAIALAAAVPAQADMYQDMYLQLLRDTNISTGDQATDLAIGHQICAGWAGGTMTAMDIANETMAQHPDMDLATALTYQTPATLLCKDAANNRKR